MYLLLTYEFLNWNKRLGYVWIDGVERNGVELMEWSRAEGNKWNVVEGSEAECILYNLAERNNGIPLFTIPFHTTNPNILVVA